MYFNVNSKPNNVIEMMKAMNYLTNRSVVAIIGATGTGKSKLGIEIAKKFNGEVINADSMQVSTVCYVTR